MSAPAPRNSGGGTERCSLHRIAQKTIPDEQMDFFDSVADPDGDFRAGGEQLANSHDFKTPCNMAIADSTPERKFIRQLCETRELPRPLTAG